MYLNDLEKYKMEIIEKIRSTGIKATTQRRAVYCALSALGHASADEVAVAVRSDYPAITVATIYRVLDSFCEVGLISKLSTPSGKMQYDITAHDHAHIIDKSGTISDYDDDVLNEMISNYFEGKTVNGAKINSVKVQLFIA